MKFKKEVLILGTLVLGLNIAGCSNTKEEIKDDSQEQVNNTLTLDDLSNKDDVTLEELNKLAVEQFGKGSDIDGDSEYIFYNEEAKSWQYFKPISDQLGINPDITELEKEAQDSEIEKMQFMIIYYDAVKAEYDEFLDSDLSDEDAYQKFFDLNQKYKEMIYGKYIEGESEQIVSTYLYLAEGLGREMKKINEIVNMSQNVENEDDRKKNFDEINEKRLEERSSFDKYVYYYIDDAKEKLK